MIKVCFIFLLLGCSSRPLKQQVYPYYVLDFSSKRLNAHDPEDDRSLDTCYKDEKYKCIVQYTDDFFAMKSELEELRLRDHLDKTYNLGLSDND